MIVPDDGLRSRQRQLAGDLRALILSGDIAAGQRLPSTAELRERYGVNNMTVTRAVAILKAEGLAEGYRGKSVVATGRRPAGIRAVHEPPIRATDRTTAVLAALGHPVREAVDRVSVRLATVAEFVALDLPGDVPVLRQFRVAYAAGRRAVEATVMIKSGQRFEIRYDVPLRDQNGVRDD